MDLHRISKKLLDHYISAEDREFSGLIDRETLRDTLQLKLNNKARPNEDLEAFIDDFLKYSVNTTHKKYSNQLWSKVEAESIIGELLCAVTNTSMYTYEVAPVATLLEHEMINYLSQIIWGKSTEGVMTSGGTASNLQALMIARNVKIENSKNIGLVGISKKPVVLAACNSHYSIKRAVNILGIGQDNLVEVDVDHNGSMISDDLIAKIQMIKESGREAFCVISTAGTTVEGSFDPLEKIGQICKDNNLWLHVDGAYGASVLLSREHKNLLKGVQVADSLSWDFHKMLGLNLPCAFLFTKEKGVLKGTLASGNDSYLFHVDDSLDLGPKSLQCGRRDDIIKLWISWMSQGLDGFEKRLNSLFNTAQNFAAKIEESSSFKLVRKPQSINVCFRFNSDKRIEDQVRQRLIDTGAAMVNYSKDEDGPFFRLAVTRPDLQNQDLDDLINTIEVVGNDFK